MDSFKPPGIYPWHDIPTHKDCGGLIMGAEDGSLLCTACGHPPKLTAAERRRAARSERYWEKALDHKDQEAWWADEYLRLWVEALEMNGTPYRTPPYVDPRQMELPDG